MELLFLTSTPADPFEGSGTFVALDGLLRGLTRLGHRARVRGLGRRTGFHTLDRWLYNVAVARRPPAGADVVVGLDLDGFLWARRRPRPPFVTALKGIIADEARHERGWVRVLLGLQARWERAACARADRVIVPSRYSADVAAAVYGVPPARLAVVPEAVDLGEWRRLFAEVGAAPASRPTVLTVARMYPRKRLADLLEAAGRLRRRIPDLALRIVGDGPEAARLRAHAGRLGLGGTVTFLGAVSRRALAVEYGRAHCFCLPSVQEGFGIVLVEAMAAGLPVVACRAAAVPEVVPAGRAGLLVEPRRPEALADALERLLTDERLRKELGEGGRQHVERFDLEPVARAFTEALPR
ncbi:MAG TPA: glycosyltransferase family 4 protein [Calidithermus sp.]|nr:glycosyltransferase family 4 protein [Calidithermus sp.]